MGVYVVTGGSSGIGYALSKHVCVNPVIILSPNASNVDLVNGPNVFGVDTDVRSTASIAHAVDHVTKRLGFDHIDGLVQLRWHRLREED